MYTWYISEARARLILFEWDDGKRRANLAEHFIDFQDAIRIFNGPVFEKSQRRLGEERTLAVGFVEGIEIVVVYVLRGRYRRIISARRAHRSERQDFPKHLRKPGTGSDKL